MTDNTQRLYIALGTIADFGEGWAIVPFIEKPHYWHADGAVIIQGTRCHLYRSACGMRAGLLGSQDPIVPGNAPKCKRCERSVISRADIP